MERKVLIARLRQLQAVDINALAIYSDLSVLAKDDYQRKIFSGIASDEDGSLFIIDEYSKRLPEKIVEEIIQKQELEIKRRILVLRNGKPLPEIKDKIVILVDDGIAMGSTMRAAVALAKNKKAAKVVVAAPVSGERIEKELSGLVDEVVILEKPVVFSAVAQAYENWYDVPDKEAAAILERWEKSIQE